MSATATVGGGRAADPCRALGCYEAAAAG
jgi:hypothetical protein